MLLEFDEEKTIKMSSVVAIDSKNLFPVPIREQLDEKGNIIVDGSSDEYTSYWKIPSTKMRIAETQDDNKNNVLTVDVPNELTQYAGTDPMHAPGYFGAQRYTFRFDKKGAPIFELNDKVISEQEYFGIIRTAVAPLLGKVLPNDYVETLENIVREQRAKASEQSRGTPITAVPVGVVVATDGTCSAFWRNRKAEPAVYCKDKEGPQAPTGKQGIRYDHLLKNYDGVRHFSGVFHASDFHNNKPLPDGYDSTLAGTNTKMLRALLSDAATQTTAGIYTEAFHLRGNHSNPIARSVGAKPNDPATKLR